MIFNRCSQFLLDPENRSDRLTGLTGCPRRFGIVVRVSDAIAQLPYRLEFASKS